MAWHNRKFLKPLKKTYRDLEVRLLTSFRSPLNIIIGAEAVRQKGWVRTNIGQLNVLKKKDWERYFTINSIDALLAEHVWEHLTPEEAREAVHNCYCYLKKGGYIRIAVPDGYHPSPDYREAIKPGGTGPGADDHKVLYNHKTLSEVFETAGFEVELLEYFDREGRFHKADWDARAGFIMRSSRYDKRNAIVPLSYTSIILDAWKR